VGSEPSLALWPPSKETDHDSHDGSEEEQKNRKKGKRLHGGTPVVFCRRGEGEKSREVSLSRGSEQPPSPRPKRRWLSFFVPHEYGFEKKGGKCGEKGKTTEGASPY